MKGYMEIREADASADGVMTMKLTGGYDRGRYDSSFIGARAFNRAIVSRVAPATVTAGDVVLQGMNGTPSADANDWTDIATANGTDPVQSFEIAWDWVRLNVESYSGSGDITAHLTLRNQ